MERNDKPEPDPLGQAVVAAADDGGSPARRRPKYSLRKILSQITAGNRHTETDWASRIGAERF